MTAFFAFCLWVLVATAIGFAPRRYHWRGAIVLLATAGPLLWALYVSYGALWMLVAALGMVSILRWPMLYVLRLLARGLGLRAE